jgi:plastocyanin
MRPRSLLLLATLAACLWLAAGCGDDSDDGGGGASSGGGGTAYGGKEKESSDASASKQLKLTADPGGAPKFDKSTLETKAGKVTVVLNNPSSVPHAIELEGKGLEEEGRTVGKGGVSKVTARLEAGEYEYYCPVGNHKDAGMEGTLTVG